MTCQCADQRLLGGLPVHQGGRIGLSSFIGDPKTDGPAAIPLFSELSAPQGQFGLAVKPRQLLHDEMAVVQFRGTALEAPLTRMGNSIAARPTGPSITAESNLRMRERDGPLIVNDLPT